MYVNNWIRFGYSYFENLITGPYECSLWWRWHFRVGFESYWEILFLTLVIFPYHHQISMAHLVEWSMDLPHYEWTYNEDAQIIVATTATVVRTYFYPSCIHEGGGPDVPPAQPTFLQPTLDSRWVLRTSRPSRCQTLRRSWCLRSCLQPSPYHSRWFLWLIWVPRPLLGSQLLRHRIQSIIRTLQRRILPKSGPQQLAVPRTRPPRLSHWGDQ